MWEKVKKIGLFAAALIGAVLAFLFLGARSRTDKGDALAQKAQQAREKADLVDAEISRLKEQKGKLDAETKARVEEIKKMEDLDEISKAFGRL